MCDSMVISIAVISLLVWPYVAFHDLWTKFTQHVITHYPEALEKAKMAWLKFKAFGRYMQLGSWHTVALMRVSRTYVYGVGYIWSRAVSHC